MIPLQLSPTNLQVNWQANPGIVGGLNSKDLQINRSGIFYFTLSDADGCELKDSVKIEDKCEAILIAPTVFTPNGDGINDILMPVIPGIKKFRCFKIYNRWGQLIFESRDKSKGWDGTYLGKPQPIETYVWQMEGEDIAGKVYTKSGLFSLIR